MGYKKAEALVNGEVIDSCDLITGVKPVLTIADGDAYDTGVEGFTGTIIVEGEDSAIVTCYQTAGAQVIGSVTGGANVSDTKDTASKLNVYVEGGSIVVQNNTGEDLAIKAKFI